MRCDNPYMALFHYPAMNELQELQSELRYIKTLSEQEACRLYNVDCKQEAIEAIQDEIASIYETGFDYTDEELEQERTALCMSLGISRFC